MKKTVLFLITAAILTVMLSLFTLAAAFVDVPANAYYAEAAQRMADQGILTGYGDGYYYGEQNVTRAQMAVVACRLLDKEDEAKALAGKTAFNDITEAHSWATGYVNYAVANSIFVGDGDGNFRPDDNLKYEEAVKVIVCVLGLDEGLKIDPTDWSKEFIEAADKAGLISNLIGKKGEAMKRSDVAVICDAAAAVLDNAVEETSKETTTKKPVTVVNPELTTDAAVEVTTQTPVAEETTDTNPPFKGSATELPPTPDE